MINDEIYKLFDETRSKYQGNNAILVLKGAPREYIQKEIGSIDFPSLMENKIQYFFKLTMQRNVITYEEFLLLKDFVIAQYDQVVIINNNIYIEQYPISVDFEESIKIGLLTHFEDAEDDSDDGNIIGNISDYIALFTGLKDSNGTLVGVYNDPDFYSDKLIKANLFETIEDNLPSCSQKENVFHVLDESDYVVLIESIIKENSKNIYVDLNNYARDQNRLTAHLSIINSLGYTKIWNVSFEEETGYLKIPEFDQILKKYWGYDHFRSFGVYDLNKLKEHKKVVREVSQEEVISRIVEEAEKCEGNESVRDVFVTAPTGAGKSVMFQIPAIYLAEKYNLMTIVISPLIGLMNDQVNNLEKRHYQYAKTINSDISPIIKQDIIQKVADSQYHILYISPETLLSRSDIDQLIGDRTIGMLVVDEAHIVTTWGKQFRPDYWYLGDRVKKMRREQIKKKHRNFIVTTFTATAIYHGIEDMYGETIYSLHMLDPITYLGYMKRNDIKIIIQNKEKNKKTSHIEYELNKFEDLTMLVKKAIVSNTKMLIYFPTVALINRFYEYLISNKLVSHVAVYHGGLDKDKKEVAYQQFLNNEKVVMLATKAFGMGIDINDIRVIAHFAPTGNICDFVQEIGRAARREDIQGLALYNYQKSDFKFINRFYGLSSIKVHQLIEVLKKVNDLYRMNLEGNSQDYTRKRNALLVDAENFSYIFENPMSDEDTNIARVKTALLMLQKDFEARYGFSPIMVRPIPLFSVGYFQIRKDVQKQIQKRFGKDCLKVQDEYSDIVILNLNKIWKSTYPQHSFPKFKYFIYSRDESIDFPLKYAYKPVLSVQIDYGNDYQSRFKTMWKGLRDIFMEKAAESTYQSIDVLTKEFIRRVNINKYNAQSIIVVLIAAIENYQKYFSHTNAKTMSTKSMNDGAVKYHFSVAINLFFNWVEDGFRDLQRKRHDSGVYYVVNDGGSKAKAVTMILGILESLGVLSFKMVGGANSQLYIYINQILKLQNIIANPGKYHNRLLENVADRHTISVEMMTYLFDGHFKSDQIWNILEDYFLGEVPDKVKQMCLKVRPQMHFY